MRHTSSFRAAFACVVLGVVLAVLGVGLVASRRSSEHARLDRTLATTAGEKAALVQTEIERVRALALLTARIPPFEEFYASAGSAAARIAAVAGPRREVDNALVYLTQLYPDRVVEAGYVDMGGREDARVVRGRVVRAGSLLHAVRRWQSYRVAVATPAGTAHITRPFRSPTA